MTPNNQTLTLSIAALTLALGACASIKRSPYDGVAEVCTAWTDTLGEGHQCSEAEGGSLNADLVHREILQKIVTEGYPLPHQEYAKSALVFHDDGTYEARKLKFTRYQAGTSDQGALLVYAEDSRGRYLIHGDGRILLKQPDYSTCDARTSQGEAIVLPHVQTFRRHEPYRTIQDVEYGIAFATTDWLAVFTGEDYWSGTLENRSQYELPPFPKDKDKPLRFQFEGFAADIHYGCLEEGFRTFVSREEIRTAEVQTPEKGVNPEELHKGMRFLVTP